MEYFLRHRERAVIFTLVLAVALQLPAAASDSQNTTTLDFANGLYARKMYGPAITEYEKFLKANPHSPEAASARFRYADSYYFTKDYAAAIAHFGLFLKEFPEDKRVPTAHFRLGTARFYQGNVALAIRELTELSRDAEDPVLKSGALFYLAKSLEEKGAVSRSLEILRGLASQEGDSEYATYAGVAIGDTHLKATDLEKALHEGYLPAAKRPSPQALVHQAQFKVAEIYFSRKQYADAGPYYEKVLEASDAPELRGKALLGLFYCDYYGGDLEAAERLYVKYKPLADASADRSEIGFLLASLLTEKKKYPEAILKLDAIIADAQADPSMKEKAQFKKIAVMSEMGQKEQSLKTLEEYFPPEADPPLAGGAPSKSPDKALSQKAELLAEIGKTDEALVAFQKLRQDFPISPFARSALYQSAVALEKAERRAEAKKAFEDYASRYPEDADADLALLQIVQMDLDIKDFKAAFKGAGRFIKERSKSPRLDIAYYKLGVAATGMGRYGHAAFAFRKVTDSFSSSKLYVESLYGMAASLENARRLPGAIEVYERLLRDHPEHALAKEVFPRLGYLYIQNQDAGKALTHYEDLIFKRTEVPLETDGVFWLIQYLLDQGMYDRLERLLDAIQARFPGKDLKHETLFFKAERSMGLKDYVSAKAYYAEAIQAVSEGRYAPHAYLGLGTAEAALGEDAEAVKNFSEAMRYDEEVKVSMRARFELANLRLKAGDHESAAKDFMLVAILYDDEKYTPPALYKAGECFMNTGKKEDAEKAFLELKTRYPASEWAKKAS